MDDDTVEPWEDVDVEEGFDASAAVDRQEGEEPGGGHLQPVAAGAAGDGGDPGAGLVGVHDTGDAEPVLDRPDERAEPAGVSQAAVG